VFNKKTAPFIFGYDSYNNGLICVKFAANVRQRMHILLTLVIVEYNFFAINNLISIIEYNTEQVAMQSIQ